jgi:hypothetical protein
MRRAVKIGKRDSKDYKIESAKRDPIRSSEYYEVRK